MSDLFPHVSNWKRGYAPEEVAAFFTEARESYEEGVSSDEFTSETIRLAAFNLVRGGYDTDAVDAAMGRLEAAFINRDRTDFVAQYGEEAWFEKVASDATVLYPRLLRPHGEKFDHPADRGKGYDVEEVDALMDRLGAFFDDRDRLTEEDIRTAMFKVSRGEDAYVEAQVDAFLGRAVHILTAVS